MIRTTYKTHGSSIDGLPPLAVLLHEGAPDEIREALDALQVARKAYTEAGVAQAEARRALRSASEVERPALADAHAKAEQEERRTQVAASRAAQALARALGKAAPVLRRIEGRVCLEQDERARKALADLRAALKAREGANPVGNMREDHWHTDRALAATLGGGGLATLIQTAERLVEKFPREAVADIAGEEADE